jgi:hypothetical protein
LLNNFLRISKESKNIYTPPTTFDTDRMVKYLIDHGEMNAKGKHHYYRWKKRIEKHNNGKRYFTKICRILYLDNIIIIYF